VADDELEKLRSNLVHAYDRRKPLARRLIEALKGGVRPEDTSKNEHAGAEKTDVA
jgi:hypothetical protein